MSTISPRMSRRLAQLHQERGSQFVAAPVFGKPKVAALAKLWICVSGDATGQTRVLPLLNLMGQKVFDLGDDPGAAAVVKLAGNFLIGSAIEAMAEAFTFAEKNGVSRRQVYELFTESLFGCFIYQQYGQLIAAETYDVVGAKPSLIRKGFGMLRYSKRPKRV